MNKKDYIFSNCASLTNINLSNLNTQNIINMSYMFGVWRCLNFEKINHFI